MSVRQSVAGRIEAGRPLRASTLVGMGALHEAPVRRPDLVGGRPALKPQDLVRLLLRHRPWLRRTERPRVAISLSVYTPAGTPAVEISL
jgi:hypothetical protein